MPPLVGWAAGTGHVGVAALLLFAIVFLWTPPHFWALALLIKDNYAAAKVPMLPVVRGDRETARQIVLYSLGLVAVTLLPWAWGAPGCSTSPRRSRSAPSSSGWPSGCGATRRRARAMLLFHYSLAYLALLFAAMALDLVV